MVHRPYTQVLLDDPALRLALHARKPANEVQRHPLDRQRDPRLPPNSEEPWLRWLKVRFGIETG